jgi:protein-disulfide isomerase
MRAVNNALRGLSLAGSLLVITIACRQAHGGTTTAAAVASLVAPRAVGPGDTLTARLDRARILGDSTARVWMIIVSDFECPYCKQWHDATLATLEHEYVESGKVRVAFVNFPLEMHPFAMPAAEAAMCAGAQGKFWSMQDALFTKQSQWVARQGALAALDSIASSVGVDVPAMNACVAAHAPDALIEADHDRAERAGVHATPTIIIGQELLTGVQPTANYRRVLDSALAH